jgi:hypothetical protein
MARGELATWRDVLLHEKTRSYDVDGIALLPLGEAMQNLPVPLGA